MFLVTNTHTFQSWTVANRDELLAELELANAKRQPLDPPEHYDIVKVDDDGQVLETAQVNFPLEETIDAVLEHFDHEAKQAGKTSLFKRLWPGVKKHKSKAGKSAIKDTPTQEDGMRELLAKTQQTEKQVVTTTLPPEPAFHESVSEASPGSSEDQAHSIVSADDEMVTTTLPPEPAFHESVSETSPGSSEDQVHSIVSTDDEVVTTTLPLEPASHESVSEASPGSSEDQAHPIVSTDDEVVTTTLPLEPASHESVSKASPGSSEDQAHSIVSTDDEVVTTTLPPLPPKPTGEDHITEELSSKAIRRGLESFSTYDLQLEFIGRVQAEVGQIDQTLLELEAQIVELKRKRGSHLKLLESINTLQLT